jgi:hypothetical protein
MGANMKHYTEDGLYSGETHKMDDGSLHTGKTHTKTSKVVSHKKKGPFKMKSPLYKKGLWDNIHAKRKRIKAGSGETMRKKGDAGAPSAKDLKDSQ